MSENKVSFYEVLGVKETDSDDTIRKAYKKLAVKWHPDKNQENKEQAEKKFKEISQAYDTLRDPKKRKEYDDFRKYGSGQNFQNFDFGGFSHFGQDMGFDFYDKMFHDIFKDFGKDDDLFKDFRSGGMQGASIKKSTVIINGKAVTRTEKTFVDKDGKTKTEVTEETSDGKQSKMIKDRQSGKRLTGRDEFGLISQNDEFGGDDGDPFGGFHRGFTQNLFSHGFGRMDGFGFDDDPFNDPFFDDGFFGHTGGKKKSSRKKK